MYSISAERNYKTLMMIVNVMSRDFRIDKLSHVFAITLEFNWIYFFATRWIFITRGKIF